MYIGLPVKYPLFLSCSTETWIFSWGVFFSKNAQYQISWNPSSEAELFHTGRQAGRRTDMTKLIVAFHNFANAPEKGTYSCFSMATIVTRTLNNVSSRNKNNVLCTLSTTFSAAFAKLRKAIIGFFMSVRPSVRMERLGSHWTDFHEILYLSIFRKKKLWRKFMFH